MPTIGNHENKKSPATTNPLGMLLRGEEGIIHAVPDMGVLASLGLRRGKKVRLVSKSPARGPLVLSVDERSVAIDRTLAERIIVRR